MTTLEEKLRNEYRSEVRLLNHKMDKVWDENLLVPNLIGENDMCLYKNLIEYCQAQKSEFTQFRDSVEPNTEKMINEKVAAVKNPLTIKISKIEKEIEKLQKELDHTQAEMERAAQ